MVLNGQYVPLCVERAIAAAVFTISCLSVRFVRRRGILIYSRHLCAGDCCRVARSVHQNALHPNTVCSDRSARSSPSCSAPQSLQERRTVVLGRPAVRAFEPLLPVRRFASILVVLAVVVNQSAKDVLVALGVCFQRSKLVARLSCTGNSGVEFSHFSVLTPVTPADIVSVLVANLVDVK